MKATKTARVLTAVVMMAMMCTAAEAANHMDWVMRVVGIMRMAVAMMQMTEGG